MGEVNPFLLESKMAGLISDSIIHKPFTKPRPRNELLWALLRPPTYLAEPVHSMTPERLLKSGLPPLDPTSPIRSRVGKAGEGQRELSPWTELCILTQVYPQPVHRRIQLWPRYYNLGWFGVLLNLQGPMCREGVNCPGRVAVSSLLSPHPISVSLSRITRQAELSERDHIMQVKWTVGTWDPAYFPPQSQPLPSSKSSPSVGLTLNPNLSTIPHQDGPNQAGIFLSHPSQKLGCTLRRGGLPKSKLGSRQA